MTRVFSNVDVSATCNKATLKNSEVNVAINMYTVLQVGNG